MLAPVCEFLSVKMGEPLDETPSLGQYSFSFTTSMFFSFLTTFSFSFLIFKAGEADSSCNFKKSSFEDLASVFFSLSSLDIYKYVTSHVPRLEEAATPPPLRWSTSY